MWKITYNVNYYYFNESNRMSEEIVDSDYVEGETIDEAIESLSRQLNDDGYLKSVIDTNADNYLDKYNYNNIDIISIDEIVQSKEIDVMKHPIFLKLIDERKIEINKCKKDKKDKEKRNLIAKEKAQLKKLKEKYGE